MNYDISHWMAYFYKAHFKFTLIKFWNTKLIHLYCLSAKQKGIDVDMDYNIQ